MSELKNEIFEQMERERKAIRYSRKCKAKRKNKRKEIAGMMMCCAIFFTGILVSCEKPYEEEQEREITVEYEKPETIMQTGYLLNGVLHTDDGNIWIPLDPPEDNGTKLQVEVIFDSNGTDTIEDDYILYIHEI